ncbi:hypothetical protein CEP53_014168 [Fusarium sp. AF-6]|nr:hypothetical protein CEP53_014168 [Fusarium sp. AF-6]
MSPSPNEREGTPEVVNSPTDTIVMDMEPDRQPSHTVNANSPNTSDPEWMASRSLLPHSTWRSTTTAMAKCDFCQRGSRGTLQQSVRDYHGNNGYTPIQPHFTSTVEQTNNIWNAHFGQPPERYQEDINGSSPYSGATLASNEDPLSWNMFNQPETEHQYDQMPSSHNGVASSYNGEWRQPIQSSSAYSLDELAYLHRQGPAANLPTPLPQASSNSWQPNQQTHTVAMGPLLYNSDLSDYDLVSVSVAPASYPRSPSRVWSTPRVMPELGMPFPPSGDTLQHEPMGPPRRYEDYFHIRQAGAASSQGQGQGSNQPFTNHHLPAIRTTTEADEDNNYDTNSSKQYL